MTTGTLQSLPNQFGEGRSTTSQTFNVPTAALLAALLVAHHAAVENVKAADLDPRSSTQLTSSFQSVALFDELVEFHRRLAGSQRELPEAAARVLRENLWQLYD